MVSEKSSAGQNIDSDIEDVIDVSSDNLVRLKEEAQQLDAETIMRYIRIFSELSGQVKYATQKRILIEMTLIKLCRPQMETTNDAVVARLENLEDKIEKGIVQAAPVAVQSTGMTAQIPQPRPQLPKAIPEEVREIVNNWAGIVSQATPPLKVYLKNARLSLGGDNNLMIVVEDGLPYDYLKEPDNKSRVEDMIASFLQKEVTVHIEKMQEGRSFEESYVDLSKLTDMDIEVVEE